MLKLANSRDILVHPYGVVSVRNSQGWELMLLGNFSDRTKSLSELANDPDNGELSYYISSPAYVYWEDYVKGSFEYIIIYIVGVY